jgi:hypothetical protein
MADDEGGYPETKIREWLDKQGYPLELRVASAFRREGAAVQVGRYYDDPTSGTQRETDVIADFAHESRIRGHGQVFVSFVIECKTSGEPWVAFTNPLVGPGVTRLLIDRPHHTRNGDRIRAATRDDDAIDAVRAHLRTDRVAHSVARVKASDDKKGKESNFDPAFNAVLSARNAAFWWAVETAKIGEELSIVFPLVIVGHDLWSCSLGEKDDDYVLEKIDDVVSLQLGHRIGNRDSTMVDIAPAADLDKLAKRCSSLAFKLAQRL